MAEFQYIPYIQRAGVQPSTDSTALSTEYYTNSDKIRFYNGKPKKIGGWVNFTFDDSNTISGCPRTLYSQRIGSVGNFLLIGTHTRLYALKGSELVNITPLDTSTTVIANSLDSDFGTLGTDPIDTVDTSTTVTINETGVDTLINAGDTIEIAGVPGAVNGIPAVELNSTHVVRTVSTNSFTIIVDTAATSTGSGGGAAVTRASGVITVNATAHGMLEGDRTAITLAATFAGLTAAKINVEHIIRRVSTNAFDIVITDMAISSVSGGGGALTEFQAQIAAGNCDASLGRGYGMGRYGVGRCGVSKTSSTILAQPRVWSFDRFGNEVILTAGGQTGTYNWAGDIATAPALLGNAPTAIEQVFVDSNIIITLGEGGVDNRVKWSNAGQSTVWTATNENFAGEDDIEGANKWLGVIGLRGVNLLFTDTQVYSMRFINRPLVWDFKKLEASDGIAGRNAVITFGGVAFWMGRENFYMFNGGTISPIPNNTVRRYVFDDINFDQIQKAHVWLNEKYSEIWFHYPSSGSSECDRYVIYNIVEGSFAIGTMDRSASERLTQLESFPRLINDTGSLYTHENGVDDDTSAMSIDLLGSYISSQSPNNIQEIKNIIPDSRQVGDMTLDVNTKNYPQSTTEQTQSFTVTGTQEKVGLFQSGRQMQLRFRQNVLGGDWEMGQYFIGIQDSGTAL